MGSRQCENDDSYRGHAPQRRVRTSAVIVAIFSFMLLSNCSEYPRDMNGTLDAVRSAKELKVGIVSEGSQPGQEIMTRQFLSSVSDKTKAKAIVTSGSSEHLFAQLDEGKIDLVIGDIALDTPWISEVTVLEPMSKHMRSGRKFGLSAIVRNGENAWMMFLERTQRDLLANP